MRLAILPLLLAPGALAAQPVTPTSDGQAQFDRALASMAMQQQRVELTLSVSERIEAEPDLALVSGGVTTTAPTATEALRQNAEQMTRVIAAVRRAGIAAADVQTQGIGLDPQYDYSGRQDGQPPRFTGYRATNTVQLRVKDVGRVGPILDALVTAGATNLSGPNYTLENADALEGAARLRTVASAQARADAYARATGYRTARLTAISETGAPPPPRPMAQMEARAVSAQDSTPTAPGLVRSEVTVGFTFLLER